MYFGRSFFEYRKQSYDKSYDVVILLDMKKFLPYGRLDPSHYTQIHDPADAKCKLARAVLAEIPRQVQVFFHTSQQ